MLVPRGRDQAEETTKLLVARGASVIAIPSIELHPPTDPAPFERALGELDSYTWIAFTSANAVRWFAKRFVKRGELRAKIAAVGPKTAEELSRISLTPHIVANVHRADALAHAWLGAIGNPSEERVLFPRAEKGRDAFPEALTAAGAQVDTVAVYRTEIPREADRKELLLEFDRGIDSVLFSSPSTVLNLIELLGGTSRLLRVGCLASIGPVTTEAAKAAGVKVHVTASPSTFESLVDAVEAYFQGE